MCSREQSSVNRRIKYDSELLIRYVFGYNVKSVEGLPNVIKICRVKVKKAGGTVLAHYYAQIFLSNDFSFEFHPGSQPKTFQNIDYEKEHLPFKMYLCCDDCCKAEIKRFVDGENKFNIAFQNCETILCKRKSMQTVLATILLLVLIINIVEFRTINLFIILFLLTMLYIVNNYLLMQPKVEYCPHFKNRLNKTMN